MLAVWGMMYRLYANVLPEVVTNWCKTENKIPESQYGFYPGRKYSSTNVHTEAFAARSPS